MEKKVYIKPRVEKLKEILIPEEERWRDISFDYLRFAVSGITSYKIHKSSESMKWRGYI